MGVEHAQGLGTTQLYLATTSTMGHGSEVREGMVWQWGEGESLLWDSYLKLFWKMSY